MRLWIKQNKTNKQTENPDSLFVEMQYGATIFGNSMELLNETRLDYPFYE